VPPLSARQVHCFLRDKVAILTVEPSEKPLERRNVCHSEDDECRRRRCSLSGYSGPEPPRDPWFDD
jgi:hypothetical protein